MSAPSCCPFRRLVAAPSSGGFAMRPSGFMAAATRSTSLPAITATARKQDVIDGVHYHFVEIPSSIDSGVAAVMLRGFWHYNGVRQLLGMIAPDVVHHHSRPAGLWLSKGGAPRAKQVISLHSMEYGWSFGYARWDRRLFNRGFAAATRVLGVSNFIREHVEQRYPSVVGKSRTVYNGVDGTVFRARRASANDPPILYVGRVEERKGVHVLVDAFEQVISKQRPTIAAPHRRTAFLLGRRAVAVLPGPARTMRGQPAH